MYLQNKTFFSEIISYPSLHTESQLSSYTFMKAD